MSWRTVIAVCQLREARPLARFASAGSFTISKEHSQAARYCTLSARLRASPLQPRERYHAYRVRSEEHTSELQSPCNLVCRLLLEKKKTRSDLFHSRHIHSINI